MNSPKYCLDTHPLIWYVTASPTLSSKAKTIIDDVLSGKAYGYISTITLIEAFQLSLKKKLFKFSQFLKTLRQHTIVIVPLDKAVLTACYKLSSKLDIHDRVIVATAKVVEAALVTKDEKIRKLPDIKTIW